MIDSLRWLWLVSRVRHSRAWVTIAAVLSVAAGATVGLRHAASGPDWAPGALGGVHDSSLMMAAQPENRVGTATPSLSPGPSPTVTGKASPKPTSSPKTTVKKSPAAKKTPPPADATVVSRLLAQINQLRANNGLPALKLSDGLIASAHKHNLKMMGSCGMQHQCPGEASLGDRISAEGVRWTSCGENIGWSGPHPDTDAALIAAAEGLTLAMYNEKPPDDGHRRNLLSTSFHHVGIDVVRDSSGKVWLTQDFSS